MLSIWLSWDSVLKSGTLFFPSLLLFYFLNFPVFPFKNHIKLSTLILSWRMNMRNHIMSLFSVSCEQKIFWNKLLYYTFILFFQHLQKPEFVLSVNMCFSFCFHLPVYRSAHGFFNFAFKASNWHCDSLLCENEYKRIKETLKILLYILVLPSRKEFLKVVNLT